MYDMQALASIQKYMSKNNETISVAESVTSGHLQAALSLAEGAGSFFQGGLTAYNIGQKARHLHTDPIHAVTCNCVSEKTAETMAHNVCPLFSSDWGIGVVGYAAPDKEKKEDGYYAFYAIAYHDKIVQSRKIKANYERALDNQIEFTNAILFFLQTILTEK